MTTLFTISITLFYQFILNQSKIDQIPAENVKLQNQ